METSIDVHLDPLQPETMWNHRYKAIRVGGETIAFQIFCLSDTFIAKYICQIFYKRPTIEVPSSNLETVQRKIVEGEAYNKQTHQSATTLRAGFLYLHPGCKSAVDFDRHATKGTEEVRRNA